MEPTLVNTDISTVTDVAPPPIRYCEDMSPSQWSRTAFAIAVVFASLPVASRIFLGDWEFESAAGIACLCAMAGVYFHIRDRRAFRGIPDAAAMLDQAHRMALAGRTDRAIARLNTAIRLTPRFWQAYQFRGELCLLAQRPQDAVRDFDQAIQLSPIEPHLYALRAQAHLALGDEAASARDFETANSLLNNGLAGHDIDRPGPRLGQP
jgi:tetratricopeptide (TPR) repeat protein